jgi:threonine dehydrogenase-like Zn-dependent dehydrogenase
VKRWTDDILPLVLDDSDPRGTLDLATHKVSIDEMPQMYETFQQKKDNCIKVLLQN